MNWNDLNTHDWFDIALGVISLLGTAVALMATVFAMRLSADANVLAKRAVEMHLFSHKKEVAPNLTLSWSQFDGVDIQFTLRNTNPGKAKIYAIDTIFKRKFEMAHPFEVPFELLLNGEAIFILETKLPTALLITQDVLQEEMKKLMMGKGILVYYKDILGTNYHVDFELNAVGNILVPTIEELDSTAPAAKKTFSETKRTDLRSL